MNERDAQSTSTSTARKCVSVRRTPRSEDKGSRTALPVQVGAMAMTQIWVLKERTMRRRAPIAGRGYSPEPYHLMEQGLRDVWREIWELRFFGRPVWHMAITVGALSIIRLGFLRLGATFWTHISIW